MAIVGYGPTGMTLAALLGQQGHSVIVLERYAGLYNLPRAACFDDEIMRTFQKLGLVDAVMPGAVVQTDYEWINGAGETLLEVSYDNPAGCGWAALYMMYQPHIEAVLDEMCKSLETVEVRQGMAVNGLELSDDRVELSVGAIGGNSTLVRARYVVGADGGLGFVRPALDIRFSDYQFQENWLVCDFRKLRELDSVPTFRQVCDPVQPVAIVRIGPQHQRFSFMLDPDETGARATDAARVWQRVAPYLSQDQAELIRVANYVFRSRIADRWRWGRVMLAGDAAHEMPPFLGQGMCSGIRDSHNLAWKLDLVLRDRAQHAILDTYQPEREPHVRFITEKAIELGRVQTLRDPEAARERDERLRVLRRARQAPEKITYPNLKGGLIAADSPHAGALFPQGRVRSYAGDGVGLFDDVVGAGPAIVCRSATLAPELGTPVVKRWRASGGRIVVVRSPAGRATDREPVLEVTDLDGVYEAWFNAHRCESVVMRPDWYLYGSAADGSGLLGLVQGFERALRAGVAVSPRPDNKWTPSRNQRP